MVVKRGSSPHTWGIRDTDIFSAAVVRFIPTYVGHTWRVFLLERSETVHPHIRGAYRRGRYSEADSYGSSPHTWGIRTASTEYRSGLRFIPTYVGHTTIPSLSTVQYAVHPHIRGAYSACCGAGWLDPVHPHIRGAYQCLRHQEFRKTGSSPHTWGIQAVRELRRAIQRFIPTYVGHTPRRGFTASTISVHPHIRGAYLIKWD